MNKFVKEAISVLNEGGIIIFPTDTVFGIGCRIDKPHTIERLFRIRQRPKTQQTPVLVNSIRMALDYWLSPISKNVRHLIEKYWPGALTVIYKCAKEKVHPYIRGNDNTLGIRFPDHKIPLKIISAIKVPLLGPSANFHGNKTPSRFEDLDDKLIKMADYILPGTCLHGYASTVIDALSVPNKIIRQGNIKLAKKELI